TLGLSDGYYATFLGASMPLGSTVLNGSDRFLELAIGGVPLTPRQKFVSVAYALMCTDSRNVVGGSVVASSLGVTGTTGLTGDLNLTGHFQLVDGTQAAGRVLISDGNGVASWQAGAAGPTPIIEVKCGTLGRYFGGVW